jgi:hypothetical protein
VRNAPAFWSVVLGLLAAAVVPAAVLFADRSARVELLWAAAAVPAAYLLGLGALAAARAGRRRAQMTLVQQSGDGLARIGRLLGILGLLLAGTGTIALVVYALLSYRGRT